MKLSLGTLPLLALVAACSQAEEAPKAEGGERLCTAEEAGAATAARAAELLKAVNESDGAGRAPACAQFAAVIADGRKARIPNLPGCRWDGRNSNGNPHFLISLHLTQLKREARKSCGTIR